MSCFNEPKDAAKTRPFILKPFALYLPPFFVLIFFFFISSKRFQEDHLSYVNVWFPFSPCGKGA